MQNGGTIVDGDISFDPYNKFAIIERLFLSEPNRKLKNKTNEQIRQEFEKFFETFNRSHGYKVEGYAFVDTADVETINRHNIRFNLCIF